ncbi:MAG TPA: FixH family protein [Kofleriaceae bacterium]|nr:FixH family protein [Kofleriaceae bacterium]
MLASRSLVVGLALSLFVPACAGGDDDDGGDDTEVNCATETRDDDFVAGMTKDGDVFAFRLMDSVPSPPDKGDNTWTIRIEDGGEGVPALDVSFSLNMPDHGHGTPIPVGVTDEGDGSYTADPINMWMPGLWDVTINADDGTAADSVTFSFCVQG